MSAICVAVPFTANLTVPFMPPDPSGRDSSPGSSHACSGSGPSRISRLRRRGSRGAPSRNPRNLAPDARGLTGRGEARHEVQALAPICLALYHRALAAVRGRARLTRTRSAATPKHVARRACGESRSLLTGTGGCARLSHSAESLIGCISRVPIMPGDQGSRSEVHQRISENAIPAFCSLSPRWRGAGRR